MPAHHRSRVYDNSGTMRRGKDSECNRCINHYVDRVLLLQWYAIYDKKITGSQKYYPSSDTRLLYVRLIHISHFTQPAHSTQPASVKTPSLTISLHLLANMIIRTATLTLLLCVAAATSTFSGDSALLRASKSGKESHETTKKGRGKETTKKNVYGKDLQMCSTEGMALTGFTRDGRCVEQQDDVGSHRSRLDCLDWKEFL